MNRVSYDVYQTWSRPIHNIFVLFHRKLNGNDFIFLKRKTNGELTDFGGRVNRRHAVSILMTPYDKTSWDVLVFEDMNGLHLSEPVEQTSWYKLFQLKSRMDPDLSFIIDLLSRYRHIVFTSENMITNTNIYVPTRTPHKIPSYNDVVDWPFPIERASCIFTTPTHKVILGIKQKSRKYTDIGGGCKQTVDRNVMTCFKREVREETGLEVDLGYGTSFYMVPGERNAWWLIAFYPISSIQELNPDPEELSEVEEMSLEEMLSLSDDICEDYTFVHVKNYLSSMDINDEVFR
jgi:ADP-ribose pyrophosphatase YjhB (NUDIX family)